MLSQILVVAVYLFLCWLVGHFGRNTKFGMWGNFAVALLLTPVIGVLVLLAQDIRLPKKEEEAAATK